MYCSEVPIVHQVDVCLNEIFVHAMTSTLLEASEAASCLQRLLGNIEHDSEKLVGLGANTELIKQQISTLLGTLESELEITSSSQIRNVEDAKSCLRRLQKTLVYQKKRRTESANGNVSWR